MNVLMFGWEFPPHNGGGLGVACRGLTRALTERGTQVTFVLPQKMAVESDYMQFRFARGVPMKVRRVDTMLSPYLSPEEYARRVKAFGGYAPDLFGEVMRYADEAADIAKEESFDVIHAHDWLSFPAGLAAKRASGKPLVLHVHLPALDQSGGRPCDPRVFSVEKESMAAADCIIAISHRIKEVLVHSYGADPSKIEVVHNGLDPEDIPETAGAQTPFKKPGEHMALFAGRLTMHKGPDKFLEAARIVAAHDPQARFVIAGSGEMQQQLIEQAAASGIGSKVFFPGFVRDAQKAQLFKAADVFVMPSVREPFGLVALEAMAAGTPAIISRDSGLGERVRNVFTVDFWDVEEMAHKMLALFTYAPLHNHLCAMGQSEARQSTWHDAADACRVLYNKSMSPAYV